MTDTDNRKALVHLYRAYDAEQLAKLIKTTGAHVITVDGVLTDDRTGAAHTPSSLAAELERCEISVSHSVDLGELDVPPTDTQTRRMRNVMAHARANARD